MDPVPGRARAVAEEYGVRLAFEDHDEMLKAGIDAVVIASPFFVHDEQVMEATKAGKHLQIQKTMTSILAEAGDVAEASRASGVVVIASPGQMHRPARQTIKGSLTRVPSGRSTGPPLAWLARATSISSSATRQCDAGHQPTVVLQEGGRPYARPGGLRATPSPASLARPKE
jgi:hypothetical protein